MLEMRENVFFLDCHLSPPWMVEPIELVWDERTDDTVLVVIVVIQHENLPVLKVFKAIPGNEDNPIAISMGRVNDTSDGLSVGLSDSVGICGYSSNFLKWFLRRKAKSFLITSNHLDPSFLQNQRPQLNSLDNPQEQEVIVLSRHTVINDDIMFLPITPQGSTIGSKGVSFLVLNEPT